MLGTFAQTPIAKHSPTGTVEAVLVVVGAGVVVVVVVGAGVDVVGFPPTKILTSAQAKNSS